MTPAFKQTEIGAIPEDWALTTLGTLFTFTNGLNADKTAYGKGIPFINVMEPITRSHIYGPEIPGRVQIPSEVALAYVVKPSDIVFNRTSETDSELGLAAVYLGDERVVFGGFVIRGRPITDTLDPKYSGYALRTKTIRSQIISMGQGAIRANIGQQNLQRVLVVVPPKCEQRAIAQALGDVDQLIDALDRLIAKKHDIKQATMQQFLTGKTRLPGFSGKWETKKVASFTSCTAGGTPSTHVGAYWGGSIKWMSSGDLHQKRVADVTGRITQAGLENSAATILPRKCVLIGLAGQGKTRGTVAINLTELSTNQSIGAIIPSDTFVSEYLFYNLDNRYTELRELSSGGGRGGLNLKLLGNLDIPLPCLSEQAAIAEVLSDMDAELTALEARRDKTRAIKQGMMQELLTGKTRLI